jgi:hypothetical protein
MYVSRCCIAFFCCAIIIALPSSPGFYSE